MTPGTAAPPSLRSAMERALEALPFADGPTATRLAGAGLAALQSVITGPGERASAVDLLAADALLTAACQAAAGTGQESLRGLLSQLGPERFERLLPPGHVP